MKVQKTFRSVVVVTVPLLLFAIILSVSLFRKSEKAQAETTINLAQTQYSYTNAMTGYYRWRDTFKVPIPEGTQDDYDRYYWSSLETSQGVYNFAAITTDINSAVASGRKFAFRVRSFYAYGDNSPKIPSYMVNSSNPVYGWWADYDNNGSVDTFVPDWNSSAFQARSAALINALGSAFNNDPRISWVEIGTYGQYGEWALFTCSTAGESDCIDYSEAPQGITAITDATKQVFIDQYVAAFPNTQLILPAYTYSNFNAMMYMFSKTQLTYPIGIRSDCIGEPGYFSQWTNRPTYWAQVNTRWQVAPIIGEFCSVSPGGGMTAAAVQQMRDYHFSAIGNGNLSISSDSANPLSIYSSQESSELLSLQTISGYRYYLRNVTLPSSLASGGSFSLQCTWQNLGNAPTYEPWQVVFQLEDTNNTVVWQGISSVQLKSVISSSNYSVTDSFTLSSIVPGTYTLRVVIKDARGGQYARRNMAISNASVRVSDMSYPISSSVTVTAGATQTPTSTPTATSTPTTTPTSTVTVTTTVSPTAIPTPTATVAPTPLPVSLQNVYFTFGKLRYGRYASPATLRSDDYIYLKNYDPKKLRLLSISLYDYVTKGNQCYTRTWKTSTSMYMRTCSYLPTKRKYAFIFKFQEISSGIVVKKYFVVNTISSATITK